MRSTIRLFKCVPVKDATKIDVDTGMQARFLEETIQHGFVLAPQILANYTERELEAVIATVVDEIGLSGVQLNSSFHKSWIKIHDAPINQLVMEQLVHYFTTYGFERRGIYDKDSVYIPRESLAIPEISGFEDGLPLTVIKGWPKDEIMDRLMDLLASGIALKDSTLEDVVNVAIYLDVDETQISRVKNKEARVMLYDHLDKIPGDPVEFLRLVLYKATKKTLLIKSDKVIKDIKASANLQLVKSFQKYDDEHGFKKLAGIFNRFKPLFLAFKTNAKLKQQVNVISKLSKKHHVPMPEDYLNQVTARMKKGIEIVPSELQAHLAKVNVFRKARLAYALKFREEDPVSIMYKVRNGTAFSKEFKFPEPNVVQRVLEMVIGSIVSDLRHLAGKKIYIPGNIVYALPSTEKQFTGDIPSGSFVDVDGAMIAGVHWQNVDTHRVDLDLSLLNAGSKIGWDGAYRDMQGEGGILFSGDMTDASDEGAAEMFYITRQDAGNYILSLNYYNREKDVQVPFTIFVATSEQLDYLPSDHVVNPNSIVCKAVSKMDRSQKVLGLMAITDRYTRFHFSEAYIGNTASVQSKDYMRHALNYFTSFYTNPVSLNDILQQAGAIIITNKERRGECDVDLSLENVDKGTFLNILKNKGIGNTR